MNTTAKRFGRVGVLYGGVTSEKEISIMSGENVLQALQSQHIDAFPVIIGDDPVRQLSQLKMDRAFVILHGKDYEDGKLQGILDLLHIPYTGSKVFASALTFDKIRSKLFFQGAGLPTAPFVQLEASTTFSLLAARLGLPFVVKPSRAGSSLGVHIVATPENYQQAYQDALKYDTEILAEKFIDGGEYTVSILCGEPLPAIKIETPNATFYDYHAKYFSDDTRYLIPSGLSAEKEAELSQLALRTFELTDCRDWGRVDIMCDKNGQFWIIEVNTLPGMTMHSLLPKAAAAIGFSYAEVVAKILETTLIS